MKLEVVNFGATFSESRLSLLLGLVEAGHVHVGWTVRKKKKKMHSLLTFELPELLNSQGRFFLNSRIPVPGKSFINARVKNFLVVFGNISQSCSVRVYNDNKL